MILTDLRQVLQTQGPLSLGEIAGRLGANPDAVRAMLEIWIGKGRVTRLIPSSGCASSCDRCGADQTEYYAWRHSGETTGPSQTCPGS